MNHDHIGDVARDELEKADLMDALKQVLLAEPDDRPKSENREPSREELNARYQLERRD